MVFYKLRKDKLFLKDVGFYSAYGIDAFEVVSSTPTRSIPDISLEKEPLEKLIHLCNCLDLDIIHLDDVVEDFLC